MLVLSKQTKDIIRCRDLSSLALMSITKVSDIGVMA